MVQKNLGRKFWVGIFFGQKIVGRKFVLAKFYLVLMRFVCDLLLITAKLNNNNTEFVWVVVGGGLHTHNVVKPTLLVKVELGFDNYRRELVNLTSYHQAIHSGLFFPMTGAMSYDI